MEGQEGEDTGREQCGCGCYSWTKILSSQYTPDFIVVCECQWLQVSGIPHLHITPILQQLLHQQEAVGMGS